MSHRNIKGKAVLVGLSPERKCVYSDVVSLDDYWDGEHVWDSARKIKKLRLATLKGYLFDSTGKLLQEFESMFNLKTGIYKTGWSRHADGTFIER